MVLLDKLLVPVLVGAFVIGTGALLVKIGNIQGTAETTALWAKDTEQRNKAMNALRGELQEKEAQHAQRTQEITDELNASSANYEAALARYRTEYTDRLRVAESRAGVYQRQSQGSSAERDALAKYAAELDRSLEQGRSLVAELGATVRQRDRTIASLKQMILTDRTLLEPTNE